MKQRATLLTKCAIIGLFVLQAAYYGYFLYRTIPSQMGFGLRWDTQTNQLLIRLVHPELQDELKVGDQITAVNDVPVSRRSVLPTPKVAEYTLSILRADEPIEVTITPIDPGSRLFTDISVTLIMLAIGAAILLVGGQKVDVVPAVAFMLTAAGWLAIPAFQFGQPLAWIVGYSTIPLVGPLYAQLAYSVKLMDSRWFMPIWIRIWFVLAGIWTLVGAFENLFLFPRGNSLHAQYGVEWVAISYLSAAAGLLSAVVIILSRSITLPPSYSKRQLVILSMFVVVGTLPLVLLTLLPRAFFGVEQLPGPVGFALLLLLPIGFLLIVLRRQHLYFEMATSRILAAILLTTTFIIIFSVIRLTFIQRGYFVPAEASVLVIAVGLLAIYPSSTVLDGLRVILYGKSRLSAHDLQAIAQRVTRQPDWQTVEQGLQRVAGALELENIVLYKREEGNYRRVACGYTQHGCSEFPSQISPIDVLPQKLAHVMHVDALNPSFSERGIYIPVLTAEVQTGFLVAVPGSTIGQLNERDLLQLRQMNDILAISMPAINLFETVNDERAVTVYSRALERQKLAARLHDGPLQDLLLFARGLKERQQVQKISHELRQICHELYNPLLDDRPEYIAKDLAHSFRGRQFKIHLIIRPNTSDVDLYKKGKLAFHYVLKEALTNITKHTRAKNVTVEVNRQQEWLTLCVSDDGGGIYGKATPHRKQGSHQGLTNMRHWASVADGRLQIENDVEGWTVQLMLPIVSSEVAMT